MKRAAETEIDKNLILESFKLIRYTANYIIKKLEASEPTEGFDPTTKEPSLFDTLAKLPSMIANLSNCNFNKRVRINNPYVSSSKNHIESEYVVPISPEEVKETEIQKFLDEKFDFASNQVNHYRLKKKRLLVYAVRVRKSQCMDVLGFIAERPTVYRMLSVLVDKRQDQMLFVFKEAKAVYLKKLERLCRIPGMELHALKEMVTMAKRVDQKDFKGTLVHHLMRSMVMNRTAWMPALRKFKEAVLRAKIKGVALPKLDEKTEKEIRNIVKVENHEGDKSQRTYIPVRNDAINPLHQRIGLFDRHGKQVIIDQPPQNAKLEFRAEENEAMIPQIIEEYIPEPAMEPLTDGEEENDFHFAAFTDQSLTVVDKISPSKIKSEAPTDNHFSFS